MDSKKRSHVASGNMPNKPTEKRARGSRRNTRGPLDFSSENVENLEPPVNIGGIVSPKIQRRRSGGSPGIKVISSGIKKSPLVVSAIKSPVRLHRWTFYEERALVEFVGLASMDAKYGLSTTECVWPAFRPGHTFWADAAKHIQASTSSSVVLSNTRVRARLLNHVKANFGTLDAAEEHYNLTLSNYLEEMEQSRDSEKRTPVKVVDKVTQTLSGEQSEIHDVAESKNPMNLKSLMAGLDSAELVELANLAFLELALQNGINSNPANFAELAMNAMKRLQDNGKNNLIYKFALCIASNRPASNDIGKEICGFSRETLVAVTTNIESMEFRRCQNNEIGYEEHPRAGSTDDVEAIIAFFHRILGVVFTLKQFKSGWRNIVREFTKRMSPDLPFYYWTLNERFRDEDQLTSFDQLPDGVEDNQDPTCHPLRLHRLRINRREDASIICAGRSFLPARNQTSIRQRIHRPLA